MTINSPSYPRSLEERFTQPDGWQWHWIKNQDGVMLRAGSSLAKKSRVHVVYVEGLSEFAEKTYELAREFNNNSINFHVLDRRGQGLSGRYLRNKFKIHAQDFSKDAQDVLTHIRQTIPDDEPVFLLGNSTGGLIGTLALKLAPERFSGAVLTAPLFGFKEKILQNNTALLSRLPINPPLLKGISRRDKWDINHLETVRRNISSDTERLNQWKEWLLSVPSLRTMEPTLGFAIAASKGMRKVQHPSFSKTIKAPVLIFTGGQDILVDNDSVKEIYKNLPHAFYTHLPHGKHGLLMETDKIRAPIMNQTFEFIRKHTP